MDIVFITSLLYVTLRSMTPILFAALGGIFPAKTGEYNIAMEGCMLIAAFVGVAASDLTGNIWIAVFIALLSSVILALIVAFFIINLGADLVIAGLAANIFVSGITAFLLRTIFNEDSVFAPTGLSSIPTLDVKFLADIPFIGPILNDHVITVYIVLILVPVVALYFKYMVGGYHMRVIGENPDAAKAIGLKVIRTKYIAWTISGILCGLGGLSISLGYVSMFNREITAGRGWIAMTAIAFGRENTLGTFLATLLFAISDAVATKLQTSTDIPNQFILVIPYVITVIVLIVTAIQKSSRKKQKLDNDKAMSEI